MVPPSAMTCQVGGRPARAGHAAPPDRLLEEQGHRLLDGGDGVPGRPVVAVQGAAQQAVPERRRVRVGPQDLLRLGGVVRVGDPLQHVVERRPVSAAAWKYACSTFAASAA